MRLLFQVLREMKTIMKCSTPFPRWMRTGIGQWVIICAWDQSIEATVMCVLLLLGRSQERHLALKNPVLRYLIVI